MMRRACFFTAIVVLASRAGSGLAQDADTLDTPEQTDAALVEARAEFTAGNDAWARGDWELAHEHYARAYGLAPRPNMLVNLAGSELRTGRLVSAAQHYREFLRSADPEILERYRAEAERALGELESRIPTARLAVRGLESGDVLVLDDAPIARAVSRSDVSVDPGPHELAAERDDEVVAMTRFTVEEGQAVDVELVVPLRPRLAPEVVVRTERVSEGGVSPWVWISIAIAVVAGAVVLGVALATSQGDEPFVGNLGVVEL